MYTLFLYLPSASHDSHSFFLRRESIRHFTTRSMQGCFILDQQQSMRSKAALTTVLAPLTCPKRKMHVHGMGAIERMCGASNRLTCGLFWQPLCRLT